MSKDLQFKMREEEVAHLLNEVEQGNSRALGIYAYLKNCEDLYKEAITQIEPLALNEASEYAEKSFKENGISFEKRNGSTRYSYSHIEAHKKLKNKLKEIEERSKQAYLSHQKGLLTASEDGEIIEFPKITQTKDSLIVKRKKRNRSTL